MMLQAYDTANVDGVANLIVYDGPRGRRLWDALAAGQVAVSESFARLHDYKPGSRVAVPGANGEEQLRVAAVVDDYISDNGAIIASMGTYRRLTGDARLDSIQLVLAPGASAAAVEREVRAALPQYPTLLIADRGQIRSRIKQFFSSILAVLGGLAVVVLGLVLAVVALVTASSLLRRRGELAALQLIGMPVQRLRQGLFAESAMLAVLAWLISVPVAALGVRAALKLFSLTTGLLPAAAEPLVVVVAMLPALAGLTVLVVLRTVRRAAADPIRDLVFD